MSCWEDEYYPFSHLLSHSFTDPPSTDSLIYSFSHLLFHSFSSSPFKYPCRFGSAWRGVLPGWWGLLWTCLFKPQDYTDFHRFILPLPELSIYSASTGLNSLTGMLTVLLISFASTILSIASDTSAVKYFSPHCWQIPTGTPYMIYNFPFQLYSCYITS